MKEELAEETLRLLQELSAEMSAARCAIHSLIATHQNREAFGEALLHSMDLIADATPPHRIALYRAAAQRYMPPPET